MDEVFYSDTKAKNILGFTIDDRSMEPEFLPGDKAVVNPNLQAHEGDFVLVKVKSSGITLIRLLAGRGSGQKLAALNVSCGKEHAVLNVDEAEIIGKVVEKKRKYS